MRSKGRATTITRTDVEYLHGTGDMAIELGWAGAINPNA